MIRTFGLVLISLHQGDSKVRPSCVVHFMGLHKTIPAGTTLSNEKVRGTYKTGLWEILAQELQGQQPCELGAIVG